MTAPPRGLPSAYALTRYTVEDIPIRVGRRSTRFDALLHRFGQRRGVLLTAWNPMSRRMAAGWNRRMQQRLQSHLRHRPVLEAAGSLRRWREDHVCVLADPRWCMTLARRFRQRAIVVLPARQPVRLAACVPDPRPDGRPVAFPFPAGRLLVPRRSPSHSKKDQNGLWLIADRLNEQDDANGRERAHGAISAEPPRLATGLGRLSRHPPGRDVRGRRLR